MLSLFSSLPIRLKIRLILIFVSTSGLLIASGAFIYHNMQVIKKDTIQHIRTLTFVIEKDLGPAMAFDDPETATDTLSTLSVHDEVIKAVIFDSRAGIFALYSRDETDMTSGPFLQENPGFRWNQPEVVMVKSIEFDDEKYGTLVLYYSLDGIKEQIRFALGITLAILIVSTAVVFLLSVKLDIFITGPILELKDTAKKISHLKDYSIRATRKYSDEIGELVYVFNRMLKEIQTRDEKLACQNIKLESRVRQRTLELKKQQEELQKSNQELKAAIQKAKDMTRAAESANRYKSQFLASMSHEIRTPLNAIIGFADLLKGSLTTPKELQYLDCVSSSGETLLGLIDDILDMSRIEAGKLKIENEPVNLKRLIHETTQTFSRPIQDKHLAFIANHGRNIPECVYLDGLRLRQILFNLIGNAVKFTQKGKIILQVDVIKTNGPKRDLVIQVTDTGIGIEPDQKNVIFDAFKQHRDQSHKQYGGTGLGLAISKSLVTMMNGTLSLESTPGKGSTFIIRLTDVEVCSSGPKTDNGEAGQSTMLRQYLPNRIRELPPGQPVQKPSNGNDPMVLFDSLSNKEKERLPELFRLYDETLSEKLEQVKQVYSMAEVSRFATEIERAGILLNLDFLVTWAQYCGQCVDSFDVDNILKAIDRFSGTMAHLKKAWR